MPQKRGFTWIELIVVLALASCALALFAQFLGRTREASCRTSCANNLRQLGIAFRMYAAENDDVYPPLTRRFRTAPQAGETPWLLLPDEHRLVPTYITDPAVFLCPADADSRGTLAPGGDWVDAHGTVDLDRIDDRSYVYVGYAIGAYRPVPAAEGADLDLFLREVLLLRITDGVPVNEQYTECHPDLSGMPATLSHDGEHPDIGYSVYRLRESIERSYVFDCNGPQCNFTTQAELPVLWDRPHPNTPHPFSHGNGGNVLYMDGHVEYVTYPVKSPMTPGFVHSAAFGP